MDLKDMIQIRRTKENEKSVEELFEKGTIIIYAKTKKYIYYMPRNKGDKK